MPQKKSQKNTSFNKIFFIVSLLALPLIVFLVKQKTLLQQYATDNIVTFTPIEIPFSAPEIPNPWRTPLYAGGEETPPSVPLMDDYGRWCWSEFETTQGQYNYSRVETVLNAAKANGGKGSFRVMPVNTSGHAGSCLPAYLRSQVGEPPNWNSSVYLERSEALIAALGARYSNDPRLAFMEIEPYGNWGEWNLYNLPKTSMTPANKQRIIRANINAFPNNWLLGLSDSQDEGDYDALNYAFSLSPKVGIRSDCLGESGFGGAHSQFAAAPDRWKTAPVVLEYCGNPDFDVALDQIKTYHAVAVSDGDGNLEDFSSYSASDQQKIVRNFKTAGFRFVINSMNLPEQITPGSSFTVTTNWSNVNVAPAYHPWDTMIQLRNGTDIVWEGKSTVQLATFLPTNGTPVSITDNFTLPETIPSGQYTVAVQVVDPDRYFKPMNLAIEGKQVDGSYPLGTITVGASVSLTPTPTLDPSVTPTDTPTPSPTPTPTPSPTPTPTPSPTPTPTPAIGNGLLGKYFTNKSLNGNPAVTRVDPTINFNWGSGSPASGIPSNSFSVRWTGFVLPKYTQRYTFYAKSDDGIRVWVNNNLIINRWSSNWGSEYSGSINLTAGTKASIKIEYFENNSSALAQLRWSSSSTSKQIVPQSQLFSQ